MNDHNLKILQYHKYKFSTQHRDFDIFNVERCFKVLDFRTRSRLHRKLYKDSVNHFYINLTLITVYHEQEKRELRKKYKCTQ